MDTDADLVLAARRGSRDALGRLFDRHWPRVWRAAYSTSGERELANDAAQEPWLVRIAVNRAIDLVRARRRLAAEELADERFAFDEPLPDEELREALGRLTPERRAVIALHYWLDCTTPEMAEVLDVPLGTVNSRLARALGDLRRQLEARNV